MTSHIFAGVKFSWVISGDWDFIKIVSAEEDLVIVDNIHDHIFFDRLDKGVNYKLRLQVFRDDEMTSESGVVGIRL